VRVNKYYYTIITVFVLLLLLAVALSAEFSFSKITSDPYQFVVTFLELWAPAVGAIGTIVVAIVIILVLNYIRLNQEREKEQSIYALHDEIDINLSVIVPLRHRIDETIKPYSTEIRLGLTPEDRHMLFERIDTTVFDNMKNAGNLRWLDTMRIEIISCYTLIKRYNSDQSFHEGHPPLLNQMQKQLQHTQRNLEKTFRFLPHYTREKRSLARRNVGEDLVVTT
jgi:hypothetical protein